MRPTTCGWPIWTSHPFPNWFQKFAPAYWSLLDSDWLSVAVHLSTPAQKPEVKLLLLSWAEPNCCPAEKSSSGTPASFWATSLQIVKGAKLEDACWGKRKKRKAICCSVIQTTLYKILRHAEKYVTLIILFLSYHTRVIYFSWDWDAQHVQNFLGDTLISSRRTSQIVKNHLQNKTDSELKNKYI